MAKIQKAGAPPFSAAAENVWDGSNQHIPDDAPQDQPALGDPYKETVRVKSPQS